MCGMARPLRCAWGVRGAVWGSALSAAGLGRPSTRRRRLLLLRRRRRCGTYSTLVPVEDGDLGPSDSLRYPHRCVPRDPSSWRASRPRGLTSRAADSPQPRLTDDEPLPIPPLPRAPPPSSSLSQLNGSLFPHGDLPNFVSFEIELQKLCVCKRHNYLHSNVRHRQPNSVSSLLVY